MVQASVSLARATLILSACLAIGMLIGLLPHNSGGQNLRSESNGQQRQQDRAGGAGINMPHLSGLTLFSRSAPPAGEEEENRALGELGAFVWNGDFADIQNQALDAVDFSMDFSFSFDFDGSSSYDYYF